MRDEEKKIVEYLKRLVEITDDDDDWSFNIEDFCIILNLIQKQQKVIDEMTETIIEDTAKLDTLWCNGCLKLSECPHKEIKQCVIQYFENKVEKE